MQVKVANIPGKKVEHQGIKVQLLGQIELASERGHPHTFISLGSSLDTCAILWNSHGPCPCWHPVAFDSTVRHPLSIPSQLNLNFVPVL